MASRICILSAVNIRHMSLISLYTRILEDRGIPYDIVYMDKYCEEEQIGAAKKYVFVNKINKRLPKFMRGMQYLKFVGYAKRVLEENQYDFIIVWNDVAIFLFGDYLAKRWRGKYCLNIRDYCHQGFRPIYNIFQRAIQGAAFTTLSSDGYKAFLPDEDYIFMHSLNEEVLARCVPHALNKDQKTPIKIGFIGNVRFFEVNKKLVDLFKDDKRFELHFYGTNSEVISRYATEVGARNVVCGASFPVSDTPDYISRIDIVNNLYGAGNPSVDYALSIKLYYSIHCHLPILTCPGTYMEQVTGELGLGLSVGELSERFPDAVYNWYTSLDEMSIARACEKRIGEIRTEQGAFFATFDRVLASLPDEVR